MNLAKNINGLQKCGQHNILNNSAAATLRWSRKVHIILVL